MAAHYHRHESVLVLLMLLALSQQYGGQQVHQPCAERLASCAAATGAEEFRSLNAWLEALPARGVQLRTKSQGSSAQAEQPAQLSASTQAASPLEAGVFTLLRELSLAVLALTLDVVLTCSAANMLCAGFPQHLSQVRTLQQSMEQRMNGLVQNYALETGMRSPMIKSVRNVRSAMEQFVGRLPEFADGFSASLQAAELAQDVGRRTWLLAHHLGMHEWIRTLAVPGRGAPMFVLHDDYATWQEMLHVLVSNIARNGLASLHLAEIGVPDDADPAELLREFVAMQYLAILTPASNGPGAHRQLRDKVAEFGARATLYDALSADAAAAVPLRALDLVTVHTLGSSADVVEELKMWELRVKPGGILAGTGFAPESQGVVQAVCEWRHFTDIHVGIGGTFWWFVEPKE